MAIPREVKRQADEALAIQNQLAGKSGPPQEAPAEPEVDWEKRFKGMKKTHDETVTELRGDKEALNARVQELEELVEKAQTVVPAVQEPIFTQAEVEEYGQDFLDMVTRVANNRSNDNSSDIAAEVKELKDQFDGIKQDNIRTKEEEFYEFLDKKVPDWEEINKDKSFHKWLAGEHPMTGRERQFFLSEAQRGFNAEVVASFFTAWKGESGQATYMPDSVGNSNEFTPPGREAEIYTAASIKQFYDDKKLGKYRRNPDEARLIEEKIFRAQKEGRIR